MASASVEAPADVRRTTLPALVYALASLALLATVAQGSLRLLDGTFPGFLVLDDGIVAAFGEDDWTGFRAGLPLNGGVVLAVDDQPFAGGTAMLDYAARRPQGTPIRYRFRHDGEVREISVPVMRLDTESYLETVGGYLFIAFSFLATGALALALRPDLVAARSLALACAAVGALFALAVDHLTAYRFVYTYHLVEGMSPAAVLHLGLVFPIARVGARTRALLVSGFALALAGVAAAEASVFYSRPEAAHAIDGAADVLMSVLGLALVASFGEALLRAPQAEQRIRAAVVFAGALLAFVPLAAARFGFFVLGWEISSTLWTPFLPLFLVALLYAIVRHNLLEAERVVRLGVGYAIATTAVFLAYAVGLSALSRLVWPGAQESASASFLLVLLIAVSFEPLRRRVQRGIDRAFYRSRVDMGHELEESSAELVTLASDSEIADYVARQLRRRLALEWAELRPQPVAKLRPRVLEPVTFRDETLGWLACGPKQSGAPFSAAELGVVKGLAYQTALALHNARAIQALRDAQQALLRSERLAAVGEFAGSVAHGIRNPLAGIRAASQVAHQQAGDGPLGDSLLSILDEVDRLDQRIRTLLDFSRPYQPSPQPTDLGLLLDAVDGAVGPQAERQGVAIEIDAPDVAVVAEADPNLLEEALLELASNALRIMPDGGKLRLSVAARGDRCEIRVADSGPGIPDGVRHRIFDLFFTTRREGTGMGLATVKKIVELSRGAIELESSSSGGTVFRIELPRLQDR
jgi:signal transduction histidine kinase